MGISELFLKKINFEFKNFVTLIKKAMIPQSRISEQLIYSKLSLLSSEPLKQELLFYMDYLLNKQFNEGNMKRKPKFGCAKGSFNLAPDFDEPLDDFKEYM